MAGGAAVLAALGAIAELELPLSVLGVLPACENMIGARRRPAVGRHHDRRRPHRRGDEPGRRGPADPRRRALVRARAGGDARRRPRDADRRDARRDGRPLRRRVRQRRRLAGRDRRGRQRAGDLAWPWPLHPRYRRLLESRVADLRNTSGRPYGYPITAATFLERFAGRGTVGARRHARPRAARRRSRRRDRRAGRAATACACSSSSSRAWPRRCARGRRTTTARGVQTPAEDDDVVR